MAEAGKGSKPRPYSVSHDEWSQRWDAIFGRDLENKKEDSEKKEEAEDVVSDQRSS
jgi:hypothetical protein